MARVLFALMLTPNFVNAFWEVGYLDFTKTCVIGSFSLASQRSHCSIHGDPQTLLARANANRCHNPLEKIQNTMSAFEIKAPRYQQRRAFLALNVLFMLVASPFSAFSKVSRTSDGGKWASHFGGDIHIIFCRLYFP